MLFKTVLFESAVFFFSSLQYVIENKYDYKEVGYSFILIIGVR